MTPVASPALGFSLTLSAQPSEWSVAYTISNQDVDSSRLPVAPFPITATLTNGSATFTVSDTSKISVGMVVGGDGVVAGSKVLSFVTNTSVTIADPATVNGPNLIYFCTTYRDFKLGAQERVKEYGSYVFTEGRQAESGELTFNFGPLKSNALRDTPIKTWFREEEFYWPPVLLSNQVIIDNGTGGDPGAGNLVSIRNEALFTHRKYSGLTKFKVEQFFNALPWPDSFFDYISMSPTGFSYDYLVGRATVEECLHGTVGLIGYTFVSTHPRYPGVIITGRSINPTNFTSWQDHVIHADQTPRDGGFLMEVVTAIAPTSSQIPPWIT
jgi:hypothetical protein